MHDVFGNISLMKINFQKIFEEETLTRIQSTSLFQIFYKFILISKLFLKVLYIQTTLVKEISRHGCVEYYKLIAVRDIFF